MLRREWVRGRSVWVPFCEEGWIRDGNWVGCREVGSMVVMLNWLAIFLKLLCCKATKLEGQSRRQEKRRTRVCGKSEAEAGEAPGYSSSVAPSERVNTLTSPIPFEVKRYIQSVYKKLNQVKLIQNRNHGMFDSPMQFKCPTEGGAH